MDSGAEVWLVWVATQMPEGEVSERSKERAWKVCLRQRTEGSTKRQDFLGVVS